MIRLLLIAALLASSLPVFAAKPVARAPAEDPLEASIAGEFALQAGQLPEAARQYLQAARSASDPVLAERATRIALLAKDRMEKEAQGGTADAESNADDASAPPAEGDRA